MAITDWEKPQNRRWQYEFQLLPHANVFSILTGSSYTTLDDVDISSVSISESYYTDTRIQAKLSYLGRRATREGFVRIIIKDANSDYVETLGTFIPTSDDVTFENGVEKTTLNLESMLYGLSTQILSEPWVSKTGDYAYTNIVNALAVCGIGSDGLDMNYNKHGEYVEPHDVRFSKSAICDVGKSYLELIYGICNASSNRLDVNGEGVILINGYTAPANRNTTFTISINTPDSVVHDGYTRSSNYLELPNECTVYVKDGENTITGRARSTGYALKGYIITKYKTLTEMSPWTQAKANELARQGLQSASKETAEWQLTMEYQPIYTGDVGYLEGLSDSDYYGKKVKVLVKNRDIDLGSMTQKLTLKRATTNDSEDEE